MTPTMMPDQQTTLLGKEFNVETIKSILSKLTCFFFSLFLDVPASDNCYHTATTGVQYPYSSECMQGAGGGRALA